jgi:hypothetical protein
MATDGNYVDLDTLLTEAQAVDSTITDDTTMVIAAFGGSGGSTGSADTQNGYGAPGEGGIAQTVMSVATYEDAYGTTDVHYYLGSNGTGSNKHGASGGASTFVSPVDLNEESPCIEGYGSCSSTNIVLLAGGGGGGGGVGDECNGGTGGHGGHANASTESTATGTGTDGLRNCGGGHGGSGGGDGNGGSAGEHGNGSDSHDGHSGSDGIGGAGGEYHTDSGAGPVTTWENGTTDATAGTPSGIGTSAGKGGEGEWRSSSTDGYNYGPGAGGGGGYGGGGGGGGGGYDYPGGGGGGGGSYARGATVLTETYDLPSASDSAGVVFTFYP